MKDIQVAIYCRLSDEDRNKLNEADDSNSIQNQKAMLIQYAFERGWKIYDIYSDDDYTGSDRKRPQFNRLLADAEERRFDIVLCKTQSRFTRELELVEKYIHGLFPIWGIRFIGVVDNADTDNKGNKKSRQINGLVNEWYLEDMSENIRSVLTNRRQNGFHIGAFALYGYKKDPEQKGHLIIDEEAAAVVREVFTLFAQGHGKTSIARILNARGIPNPTEYKRRQGLRFKPAKSHHSTLWRYSAIADMLINEIYIGNMVQGKYGSVSYKTKQNRPRPRDQWYIVEGTHEPIIDKELWDKVQAMVSQRAKPFSNGQVGLFSRKVRCANCGYTLQSTKHASGRRYLRCPTKLFAKESCVGANISVDRLEQIVIAEINRLNAEYLDRDALEAGIEFSSNLKERQTRLEQDLRSYESKLEEYSKGIREIYMDKVRGIISEQDFVILSSDLSGEKRRLEGVISEVEKQLTEIKSRIEAGDNRRELIAKYTNLEHLTREIIDTLIDYIVVGKHYPGQYIYPVEIHWKF